MKTYTLITGASSGLGSVFAKKYAEKGVNLLLVARRTERLMDLQSTLMKQYAIDIAVFTLDLSDAKARLTWLESLKHDYIIDRIINNAGFGYASDFDEMPNDIMLNMQRVNMEALSEICHALIPSMKTRRSGEIMNVASVAAFVSGPYMACYYATKAYVLSLSQALHLELKAYNIKVSALCPGPTHTEFFHVAKNPLSPLKERMTMSSEDVVIEGIRDLEKNQVFSVPGYQNKLLVILLKFLPRSWAAQAIIQFQKPTTKVG